MKIPRNISTVVALALAFSFDWMAPRHCEAAANDEHQIVALAGDLDPLGTAYGSLYPIGLSNAGVVTSYVSRGLFGTGRLYRIVPGGAAAAFDEQSVKAPGAPFFGFYDIETNPIGSMGVRADALRGPDRHALLFNGTTFKSIATTGSSAVGDGTIASSGIDLVTLSDSGAACFIAKTTGSGYGVFLSPPVGALQLIAKAGDSSLDSGVFTSFEGRPAVTSPATGLPLVAFFGKTSGTVANGLFAGTTSGVRIVAANNSYRISDFAMNNAGQLVYADQGIYINTAATGTTLLIAGNAIVPGPRGGTLSNPSNPAINSAGDVVFRASVVRGGNYLSAIILRTAAGVLLPIAVAGEAIDGGVFNNTQMGVPQVNESGLIMFTAAISKGSSTTYGIFLADATMVLKLIATGDLLAGSVITSVFGSSGPEPASRRALPGHSSFNEAGQVAYRANLVNGKSGIFLSTPAIPWIGTGTGAWDDAANWGFGHVPGVSSNAVFDSESAVTSAVPSGGVSLRKLTVGHDLAPDATGYLPQVIEIPTGATLTTTRGVVVRRTGVLHGAGNLAGPLNMGGYQRHFVTDGQSFGSTVSYESQSTLRCIISANNAAAAPATVGALNIVAGAQFQVALNEYGSSTDFSDAFWKDIHTWRVLNATSITGTFQWSGYADIRADSKGVALSDAIGVFSLRYTSKSVELIWTPHQEQPTVTAPSDQLVSLGSPVSLSTDATGNALVYLWSKNAKPIAGASTSTLNLGTAALAHAGIYTVTARNSVSAATSTPATRLAVLDRRLPSKQIAVGSTLSLKAIASAPSGTALTYTWRNGSTLIVNGASAGGGLISGAGSASLQITKASVADIGSYTCTVEMGTLSLATEAAVIDVVSKPIVDVVAVPVSAVGQAFTWQLTATQLPQSFSISGLPKGLVANPGTGLIQGVPSQSGNFTVKVSASNAAGSSAVQNFLLDVGSLPTGTAGTFSALVEREATVNASLGGLLTLTVQPSGAFTGTLKNGTATTAIKGQVLVPASGLPHASLAISTANSTPLQLELDFDGANTALSGTLADGTSSAVIVGQGHVFSGTSASAFAALYNSAIELPSGTVDDGTQPQGSGWQQMTVKPAGTASGSGRTPDGISYTFSGSLWPNGSLPQFALLYSGNGSLAGLPQITLGTAALGNPNNRVGGWVEQYKSGPASTKDRTFKTGIPLLRRDVDGAPWIKPTSAAPIVMGLADVEVGAKNARITFTGGGLSTLNETSLAQDFRFLKNNTTLFDTVAMGNANSVKLTVTPSTGLFTSGFTLLDGAIKRVVTANTHCTGILLSHKAKGVGYFLLSGLATDSDILSGRVVLE